MLLRQVYFQGYFFFSVILSVHFSACEYKMSSVEGPKLERR